MNTLDKMTEGCSTHLRLCSESVKNFDLYKGYESEKSEPFWNFGFSLMKGKMPNIICDEEEGETQVLFSMNQKGLESLINFLNLLMKERDENQ